MQTDPTSLNGRILTCPYCGHRAGEAEFDVSLVCECWCPVCGKEFMVEDEDDEED